MSKKTGKLLVLSGPSAVGKGTVAKHIVENFSNFYLSVSATTRDPRPGEIDGISYLFIDQQSFMALVESMEMLEWAEVHGKNLYGTPKLAVKEALEMGRNVILEIDVQGARQVKNLMPEAVLVFIKPPAFSDLEVRMAARGTESPSEVAIRLETAREEIEEAKHFDYQVVNDNVARCAQEVVDLVNTSI
jgi:guanylate kinase